MPDRLGAMPNHRFEFAELPHMRLPRCCSLQCLTSAASLLCAIAFLAIAVSPVISSAIADEQKGTSSKQKADEKNGGGTKTDTTKSPPAKTSSGKGEPVDEVLTASDRWPIHVTYYESPQGKESPVVILLAGAEGPDSKDSRNRRIWGPTALALQRAGYAVVTVDLRKHGDSLPPATGGDAPKVKMASTDYVDMVGRDLEIVKLYLLDLHQKEKLNIRKLGIVSVGSSSMVSAAFAVADWLKKPYPDAPTPELSTPRGQDVRALIMYSPNSNVKGINTVGILKGLKALQVAVYVVASQGNDADAKAADRIFKGVELKGEEFADVRKLALVPGTTRAEGFLEGKYADPTQKDIIAFMNKNLKELEFPWASRKSRLE